MQHEAVYLDGSPINWNRPPKPTAKVLWTKRSMYGKRFEGSLYSICAWNRLNNLALKRFNTGLTIIQTPYNTTVAASKGTHDRDFIADFWIPGVDGCTQQRFARANGFMDWYRHAPLFGNHQHGGPLPPQEGHDPSDNFREAGFTVGYYVDGGWSMFGRRTCSSQIEDFYNEALGLSGAHTPGSDDSWFPSDIEATIFDLDRYIDRRQAMQKKRRQHR